MMQHSSPQKENDKESLQIADVMRRMNARRVHGRGAEVGEHPIKKSQPQLRRHGEHLAT